ncbi:hypothetical protein AVEN_29047-1 [Araneus ventricosus]|uniref:C2H2-type domain-containing protein n=1 Tax=Araneus ventricosus TaxID=182803 RepID=A0A4Y2AJI9_ARAVE|nr:hypothetical protein AVEN_29047-1 [Araneus ventricosus]
MWITEHTNCWFTSRAVVIDDFSGTENSPPVLHVKTTRRIDRRYNSLHFCPQEDCTATFDDVASLEEHLIAATRTFTKISSTLDKVRFSYTEKLKASTGKSPIAANEPKNLANNITILNVFRRCWSLPNRKITRFSSKQKLYNIFMKGKQSGVKSSPENTVKEMRQQIDPTGRKLFQPFKYMTSSQIKSLFNRMSVLHKGVTLKPSSPGLELVDNINEDLDDIEQGDITKQELEQQEVQNLLTTLEPIQDVQLQLAGYKQKKDDKGKKRSLNICPTTPKRIKSIYDENNDSISTDNSLESDESHKITQQLCRSDSIQDIKMKLIQRAVQEHLYFAVFYEQDLFYIGKEKKIEGEDILLKFLEKGAGNFRWPKIDQEEKVNNKFIFYGPVQLCRIPFTMDIHQIIIAYNKCYKKNRLAIWK